jgi:cell pole-organizing protein PopZ
MTAEPRMEDLLASIRKAMDDESGGATHGEPGNQMRGALREMRVAFEKTDERRDPQVDVDTLRSRVKRNSAQAGFSAPPMPPLQRPQDAEPVVARPSRSGFANILAGLKQVQQPPAEPPPFLRRTITSDDFADDYAYPEAANSDSFLPYEDDAPAPMPEVRRGAESHMAAEPDDEPIEPYYEQPRYSPPPPPPPMRSRRPPIPVAPPPMAQAAAPQRALVSEPAARASRRSFDDLAEALLSRATGERGLEDVTREMLRGMLRQWLDENLSGIVEKLVREEIERVARRGH